MGFTKDYLTVDGGSPAVQFYHKDSDSCPYIRQY